MKIFMVLKEVEYGDYDHTEFDSEVIFASENRVKAFQKYCECSDNKKEYEEKEFFEYYDNTDNGEFVNIDFYFTTIELS